jgi:putative exosortase-associated protein (TIGR04073 family)
MLCPERNSISRRRIMGRVAMSAALVGALLTPTLSQAIEYTAARKAGRGLAAMTTGFLEIPGNMVAETRKHGAAGGLPLGFVFGLGKVVIRELVGVYEFVTAPLEAPAGFKPIIEPEFPWGYFDDSSPPANAK